MDNSRKLWLSHRQTYKEPLCVHILVLLGNGISLFETRLLNCFRFEIVVIMGGSSDSTGQMTQTRTSYLPIEFRWGHRFKACVSYDYESHAYVVQKEFFNATEVVDTPLCSAKRLHEVMVDMDLVNNCTPNNSPMSGSPPLSPLILNQDISFEQLVESYVWL